MIRPARFGFNPETAESNAFQQDKDELTKEEISRRAVAEFDAFVEKLRSVGIEVIVVEDTEVPVKTDAVFPNNWITTHTDGTIITYPMLSAVRRLERRQDIVEQLQKTYSFREHFQLEQFEEEDRMLEGTGSLILDRDHKIAYACHSPRTDEKVLEAFCDKMGYEVIVFDAVDGLGQPIYHTNVMMALGEDFVVICMATIRDKREREKLLAKFEETGKAIIEITLIQLMTFAGNMLQVRSKTTGKPYLVMSKQAYDSLTEKQIAEIKKYTEILYSPLKIIETYGGGSARCMMAEVFVPGPD